jgi:hypothetical protein
MADQITMLENLIKSMSHANRLLFDQCNSLEQKFDQYENALTKFNDLREQNYKLTVENTKLTNSNIGLLKERETINKINRYESTENYKVIDFFALPNDIMYNYVKSTDLQFISNIIDLSQLYNQKNIIHCINIIYVKNVNITYVSKSILFDKFGNIYSCTKLPKVGEINNMYRINYYYKNDFSAFNNSLPDFIIDKIKNIDKYIIKIIEQFKQFEVIHDSQLNSHFYYLKDYRKKSTIFNRNIKQNIKCIEQMVTIDKILYEFIVSYVENLIAF